MRNQPKRKSLHHWARPVRYSLKINPLEVGRDKNISVEIILKTWYYDTENPMKQTTHRSAPKGIGRLFICSTFQIFIKNTGGKIENLPNLWYNTAGNVSAKQWEKLEFIRIMGNST
jgi:hypothetical protein